MSHKKHRGDHAGRAERRATAQSTVAPTASATGTKPRRVYLRNKVYIALTLLVIVGVLVLLVGFEFLGLWDNILGSILSVLLGAFGCMCVYDIGLLMTACITFGEGMINAGKNAEGHLMVFHASSVVRLELRDTKGTSLPADLAVYKNIDLAFVMASGRVNLRRVSRLTQKQLRTITEALEAERTFCDEDPANS